MIISSNSIEHAGLCQLSPKITDDLCRTVFNGERIDISSASINLDASEHDIIEVTQHADAFQFLVEKIVFQNEDFSEELILEVHRILHRRTPHPDGEGIAGVT